MSCVKEKYDENDTSYIEMLDVVNKRLTDLDNTVNRHSVCNDKCLKRKDGSMCQNCKYKFPKQPRENSSAEFKFYDNIMILADLICPSNDA